MEWTTTKPTQPGWYWAREQYRGTFLVPEIVEVRQRNDRLIVITYVEDEGGEGDCLKTFKIVDSPQDSKFAEWAGPLELPEEKTVNPSRGGG